MDAWDGLPYSRKGGLYRYLGCDGNGTVQSLNWKNATSQRDVVVLTAN